MAPFSPQGLIMFKLFSESYRLDLRGLEVERGRQREIVEVKCSTLLLYRSFSVGLHLGFVDKQKNIEY